jgi:hypothetical protein
MSLLDLQIALRDAIAAGDDTGDALPHGMAIYRDAYRGRLLTALETSFERTCRWVGAEAFTAAACHYILTDPPRGWTLDEYGAAFPHLLATLFADDPEVAELAWLEWHMQAAFAAPDAPELDHAALAGAGHAEADWDRLGFDLAAGFAARAITMDCAGLWSALADDADVTPGPAALPRLLVWRSGLSPRFRTCDEAEFQALSHFGDGGTLGVLAARTDPACLAGWLTQWLGEGLFARAELR